jgi:hypothetical protein
VESCLTVAVVSAARGAIPLRPVLLQNGEMEFERMHAPVTFLLLLPRNLPVSVSLVLKSQRCPSNQVPIILIKFSDQDLKQQNRSLLSSICELCTLEHSGRNSTMSSSFNRLMTSLAQLRQAPKWYPDVGHTSLTMQASCKPPWEGLSCRTVHLNQQNRYTKLPDSFFANLSYFGH